MHATTTKLRQAWQAYNNEPRGKKDQTAAWLKDSLVKIADSVTDDKTDIPEGDREALETLREEVAKAAQWAPATLVAMRRAGMRRSHNISPHAELGVAMILLWAIDEAIDRLPETEDSKERKGPQPKKAAARQK